MIRSLGVRISQSASRIGTLLVVFMTLIVAGCDTTSTPNPSSTVTVVVDDLFFSFDADETSTGRLTDLVSLSSANVEAALARSGNYTRAQISGARVRKATLEVMFPVRERVDFLQQVVLKLDAPNFSPLEVGEQNTFSSSADEVDFSIRPNRDISSFLTSESFSAILSITPRRLEAGERYQLALILTLDVTVDRS